MSFLRIVSAFTAVSIAAILGFSAMVFVLAIVLASFMNLIFPGLQ